MGIAMRIDSAGRRLPNAAGHFCAYAAGRLSRDPESSDESRRFPPDDFPPLPPDLADTIRATAPTMIAAAIIVRGEMGSLSTSQPRKTATIGFTYA